MAYEQQQMFEASGESYEENECSEPIIDTANLLVESGVVDLPLARRWMCEQLRLMGAPTKLLIAMNAVPRHCFAPHRWRVAYLNLDLWTGITWLTAPRTIARVVSALPERQDSCLLEIGTGTGYQTAILAALGGEITTTEISQSCFSFAQHRLSALHLRHVQLIQGDGLRPGITSTPFNAIVINAALSTPPISLVNRLSPKGGVIIAPVYASDGSQRLLRYSYSPRDCLTVVDLGPCKFPALVTAQQ
jgi:protein-L-isoaspartate(D-aspartate) O-methyltransferase